MTNGTDGDDADESILEPARIHELAADGGQGADGDDERRDPVAAAETDGDSDHEDDDEDGDEDDVARPDVEDGAGCTEIWERLSERRAED